MTGGSDAHSESGVGTFATKFTFDTDSIEDIVTQLYNNQVCPVYKKDDNWIDLDSNYFQN